MSDMTRRSFALTVASGLCAAASSADTQGEATAGRPNILLISSDNQSFHDIGYARHPVLRTPNLDRIAAQGTIFSNAHCAAPVCVPARASLMTGMYPSDVRSFCNATPWDGSQPTWGTRLQQAGYYTRSIGKLDLDKAYPVGFEALEVVHGHDVNPDITAFFRRPLCYRMDERVNVNGGPRETPHTDAKFAGMAIDFITKESKALRRPWALYVSLHEPHVAYFERQGFLALKKYYDQYYSSRIPLPVIPQGELENQHLVYQSLRYFKRLTDPIPPEKIRRALAGYYGMISELDSYVGQVYQALADSGQLDNTLLVFTSDNGMLTGDHGLFYHNCLYDQAIRIPLFMAGPGVPKGRTVSTAVHHVDLVATMLRRAGAQGLGSLRGHDLTPLMRGERGDHPGFAYCENHSEGNVTGGFVVRKGDWKYIHFTWYDDLLFNVAEDPREIHNRISDPSAKGVLTELKDILHSSVDPDRITDRAFQRQRQRLDEMVSRMSEDELYKNFEFRLGPGQARALARALKGR